MNAVLEHNTFLFSSVLIYHPIYVHLTPEIGFACSVYYKGGMNNVYYLRVEVNSRLFLHEMCECDLISIM